MANDTTNMFQTLVAASSQASQHLKFRNAFLDAIYWDYQPGAAAEPYTTLNVIIPSVNEGDIANSLGGPYSPTDTTNGTAQITLDKDFTSSFLIRNWDEVRTPVMLKDKYVQPRMEAMKRKVNRTIAALVNTTNFADYALISGAGADVFQRTDLAGAWKNLADAGVPVEDSANMSFLTSTLAYSKMLASTEFSQDSIVGTSNAQLAQQQARISLQLGAQVAYDQHIVNYNSGKEAGILMHRYAIAGVTVTPPSNAQFKTVIFLAPGVPLLIEMGYSIKDRGWLVGMNVMWGLKVVRSAFGSLVETT